MKTLLLPHFLRNSAVLAFLVATFGCSLASDEVASSFSVSCLSGAPLEDASPTPRLRLEGVGGLSPEDLYLIEGTIGSTTQSRLRSGEVSPSLEGRRRPLSVWREEKGLVAAAAEVLEPGSYSLVARFAGTLAEMTVTEDAPEVLRRLGSSAVSAGAELAYCALSENLQTLHDSAESVQEDESAPPSSESGPSPIEGVAWGLDADWLSSHCLRLQVRKEWVHDGIFVPPLLGRGRLIDPAPVPVFPDDERQAEAAPEGGSASIQETRLGDERAATTEGESAPLRDGECETLWGAPACLEGVSLRWDAGDSDASEGVLSLRFEDELRVLRFVRERGIPVRLGPLPPAARVQVRGLALIGVAKEFERHAFELRTGAARAHFVLTEVMADPDGPEPESEWVEIFNAGTASGSLAGFWIADEGGATRLPDITLAAGDHGLIVRGDFLVDEQLLPAPDAVPVIVSSLGENGLRNSGEAVELRGPDGFVHSAVPAGSPGSGRSWARREPWAHDGISSFSMHGEPGASPGAPNTF